MEHYTISDAMELLNEGQGCSEDSVTVTTSQDGSHFLAEVSGELLVLSMPTSMPELGRDGRPVGYTHMLSEETVKKIRAVLGIPHNVVNMGFLTGIFDGTGKNQIFRFFCPDDHVSQVAIAIDCKPDTSDGIFHSLERQLNKLTSVFYAKWYPSHMVNGELLLPHCCYIIDTPEEIKALLEPGFSSVARIGGYAA